MVQEIPITDYKEYQILCKNYIPDLTPYQAEMIKEHWPLFWESPDIFKDTDLKDIIMAWLEAKIVRDNKENSVETAPKEIEENLDDESEIDDFKLDFFHTVIVSKEDAERQIREGRVSFDEFYKAVSRFIEGLDDLFFRDMKLLQMVVLR